ncbi:3-deoxy-D-manno-octulosonic acid transferase [uncultured Tateyamaria sp.]|uniref:3-deoxy-D-manno-octulosonic acid transferase n=1 Tax=uncultured Tateyamaria sp. TaxID=455651 RepID=UPI00260802DD|nr:3-deoxy-D-manno-octulosonic acid transferase [uncultured Tateyamaria sp.]
MRPTFLFRLYQALVALALPFAARRAVNKLRRAGVSVDRAHERLGHATAQRGFGPLIWFHAASVGEAKSVLPLIAQTMTEHPDVQVLLTSGTATSAQVVSGRLPRGAVHQFGPLDGNGPLNRFLRHWRPDLCVLVESELWPNLLDQCARRDIPLALLNARLSENSAQGWKRFPATAAYVMRGITLALCQDRRSLDHLRDLGVRGAAMGVNLKSLTGPPLLDPSAVAAAHAALGDRPVWVAASTHPGEEEIVLAAHKRLCADRPDLCLILVPRHPERANQIVALIEQTGLNTARRSTGANLGQGIQVYLADTMGETDLWYTLSPIVFLGGSFAPVGGHTPYEPAAADTAILHGPLYDNFSDVYATFLAQDASVQVKDAETLCEAVRTLLDHPARAARLARNARPLAVSGTETLARLGQDLYSMAAEHAEGPHD